PANHQLYGAQLNPGGFTYAGNDPAQQGLKNVADVAIRNASAEFSQLRQALTAHGIAKSDAEVWRMVGITPEIGRNYTNESSQGQAGDSNVIFSLDDAQTVKTFAESKGVGLIAMWALGRDQSGNPNDPTHYETNSSLVQSPYQFSQIFSSFGTAVAPAPANQAPTVATAAGSSASTVTGRNPALSVLGRDEGGEATLKYTWAATGPAPGPVSFSATGTNAAKIVTATFNKAGTYSFVVTIRDAGGLTATSGVTVVVSQT